MSDTTVRTDAARGGLLPPHDSLDTTQYNFNETNSGTDGTATMAAVGGRGLSGRNGDF